MKRGICGIKRWKKLLRDDRADAKERAAAAPARHSGSAGSTPHTGDPGRVGTLMLLMLGGAAAVMTARKPDSP
ncbi:MAG: hypothetical protein ACOX41_03185 [Anaerovoracaceae bacterium]